MTWSLVVLAVPRPKKNSGRIVRNRRTGAPLLLPSERAKAWEAEAIRQLRAQWRGQPALETDVRVRALIYRARRVGDLANYLNAVHDALERSGVLYNDRQVVADGGSELRHDPKRPRVEITVEEVA